MSNFHRLYLKIWQKHNMTYQIGNRMCAASAKVIVLQGRTHPYFYSRVSFGTISTGCNVCTVDKYSYFPIGFYL